MANSQGRKLYRVTLSAQGRRDLKAIGHRSRLAPGTGPDAEGRLSMPTLRWARRRSSACASAASWRDAALSRKEQVNRRPKRLDGAMEAKLVALLVPTRGLWTLKLHAGRLVEIVERISEETVRKTLKKRDQAVAEAVLVHSTAPERTVGGGGCA